jgi:N-acetylglucosamine-6-phosphate deacetylase
MTVTLGGANLVLPDRVLGPATLAIENEQIAEIVPGARPVRAGATHHDLTGHFIVPGFVDVHVHGVDGLDSLDAGAPLEAIARRLTRYGVTAFCPTTVACTPVQLALVLAAVEVARRTPAAGAAHVLPAHLESNFINAEYRGAQPLACVRAPRVDAASSSPGGAGLPPAAAGAGLQAGPSAFTAEDVLAVVAAAPSQVAIVTMAPEIEGGLDLVRRLTLAGHRVSMGHSGADYEQGLAGVEAGARHATHLFNRMPPFHHRAPGLVGAVLDSEAVAVEIICDGYHVHPALVRSAVARKSPSGVMAITDGTAGSGLPVGSRAALGGRPITVREQAAFLDDGTLAGSVLTMDGAFRRLVREMGFSLVEAAHMCATTPARRLGLAGQGRLAAGMVADLAVLDGDLAVSQTWVGGRLVFRRGAES